MDNPFKEGDTVYHITLGEKVVKGVVSEDTILVGDASPHSEIGAVSIKTVSFEPWPEPVHKRPLQDGWWIVSPKTVPSTPYIRRLGEGWVYSPDGSACACQDFYVFHKFIGKDWK